MRTLEAAVAYVAKKNMDAYYSGSNERVDTTLACYIFDITKEDFTKRVIKYLESIQKLEAKSV